MENIETKNNHEKDPKKEQLIILNNKENLSISGTNKIISLRPDLIQLDTVFGGLIITGTNMELIKLDNSTTRAEINGDINSLKFIQGKSKEPFFRKLFK